jgi:hypothetical protein
VHAAHGRQAGADVQELADALAGQVADGALQEVPVIPARPLDARQLLHQPVACLPVGGEIVLPAEEIVINPRDIRDRGIKPDARYQAFLPAHMLSLCH